MPGGPPGYQDGESDDFDADDLDPDDLDPDDLDPDDLDPDEWSEPITRPTWWRWVALIVVMAMVVATPFAYALYLLLN
jgi:hypothetical protein